VTGLESEASEPRLGALLGSGQPVTWVFTGDSITHGLTHTHGRRSYPEHVHERIRGELRRDLDVVVNTGVAGWTAPQVLAAIDHLVLRFGPQVASVAVGMNDAANGPRGRESFGRDLAAIAARLDEAGAVVLLHTPPLAEPGADHGRDDLPAYAEVVRAVAEETGSLLVDHAAHWEAQFGGGSPVAWLDDPFHPNDRGHWEMARLTLDCLGLAAPGSR
jgi:lysophospholipase L1-like esterase